MAFRLDPRRLACHHVSLAEIAVIGQQRIGLADLAGQSVEFAQHRLDLLFVGGSLDHNGDHHQQAARGNGSLAL